MRRIVLTFVIGSLALFGATACGPGNAAAEMVASAEAEALAAMGVEPEDIVVAEQAMSAAEPSKPAKGDKDARLDKWRKRHAAKVALHRNVLHGEAVVETKEGTITVAVQRGVITAISGDSVTVKSSDGVTWTWKFHSDLRVVEKRAKIQPSELKAGATVALAGRKEGETLTARLIVIPLAK